MTLHEQLQEAERALHELAIGKSIVQVRDSNGERVDYTPPTRPALLAHIASLERRIAAIQPVLSAKFSTSKGV